MWHQLNFASARRNWAPGAARSLRLPNPDRNAVAFLDWRGQAEPVFLQRFTDERRSGIFETPACLPSVGT